MDRTLINASQVTPSLTRKWCVLIQVVHRGKPKKKENGPRYRNYILTDSKGTMIPMIMFDKDIEYFSNTLVPYKRYYISNAIVKDTHANYRHLEYPYTWTLHRRNLVERHEEAVPPPFPCTFRFDSFNDFYRKADQEDPICIKALVVHTLPVQETKNSSYKDCVVINEEMIPMLMQIWDDVEFDTDINVYAKYRCPTLIVANGLRVTTQHGLSLRTKMNAYILEDPPLPEEIPLKQWYNANAPQITSLIEARAYRDPAKLFHPPRPSEILPLSLALTCLENSKAVWTEGTITFLPAQQHIWFEACEKCLTPLDVDTDWRIMCPYCKEFTNVTVRYDIGVFLNHGTSVIEASVKSPEIEKLLPYTAKELTLAAAQNKPLTNEVEAALQNKHVICFLKYYDRERRGLMQRRYPLVKLYTEADISAYNTSQQHAALTHITSEEQISLSQIGSSSSPTKAPTEKQFFTPTLKTVLEEVPEATSVAAKQQSDQLGTKRMLAFEEPQSDKSTENTTEKAPTSISPPATMNEPPEQQPNASTETTPTKKLKGKDTAK